MFTILFISCQVQEEITQESGKKIETKTVSYKELITQIQNKTFSEKNRNFFINKTNDLQNRDSSDFITSIDTTKVERITIDQKDFYTLRITTQEDTENKFYNMIVYYNDSEIITNFIKYDGIDTTKEGAERLLNSIKTVVDDNGNEVLSSSTNRDNCTFTMPIWKCSNNNAHGPDVLHTPACSADYTTLIGFEQINLPCTGDAAPEDPTGNENQTNPQTTNTNTGGGSNTGANYNVTPVYTIPVLPTKTLNQIFYEFRASLSLEQRAWWNLHPTEANEIAQYLFENQVYDIEDEQTPFQFMQELIDASILLDINAIAVWDDYDLFRGQMSFSERDIFDNLPANRKLWYMVSAKKASDKAKELFPNSTRNGKGDAFRHALWNGLTALTVTPAIAQELTTAHENKPSQYQYNFKEKEMDLYNNQKGLQIALISNISDIIQNILSDLNNGYLKYLNNLEQSEIPAYNYRATINSVLIPTDQ